MKHFITSAIIVIASTGYAAPLDWLKPDAFTEEKLQHARQELQLTEEQASKIDQLVAENRSKAAAMEDTLKSQQGALDKIVRTPGSSPEEASAALAKLIESEAALKQNQLRTVMAIRDLLTPEQQRKIAKGPSKGRLEDTPLAEKAARAKNAVDGLGVPPTQALKERAAAIEALVHEGKMKEAETALDKLLLDSGAEIPDDRAEIDFSTIDPGDTTESVLKERLDNITKEAQQIIYIPTLRKLLKAKEALDSAIASQDAVAAGRILSWAEQEMKKQPGTAQ